MIGGGDGANYAGIISRMRPVPDNGLPSMLDPQKMRVAWRQWAESLPAGVHVGHLPGCATLLSHGRRQDRRYDERHKQLADFEPQQDVRLNGNGVLEWSTYKPQLHCAVWDYFVARKEDD